MYVEFLTIGTVQIFISLIRFLQYSFVSSSFLLLLMYSFFIFSFPLTGLIVSASSIFKYFYIFFSPSVLIFSWYDSSIPSVMCPFPLLITNIVHFSLLNYIPISWLYILTVCIRSSISFSFSLNSLYIRGLIFSWNLLSLFPPVHFLRMWLIGIITIINDNGDSESPWNMPLWIFTSVKFFPPAVNSTIQVAMVFSINCTIWSCILYFLRQSSIQLWGTIS